MADKIRGITVQLSADVSKVLDGLKDVEKNLKSTTKNLKDVDKALKLDPNNTELLKQKQELLAEAIEQTKEKSEMLQEAQEKAAEEAKNGSEEAQKAYDLLTRQIVECNDSLSKLYDEAEKTQSSLSGWTKVSDAVKKVGEGIETAGSKVSDFGDSISNLGSKVSVVSGAVAALGAAAVEAFTEVDAGADTIITKTGATGVQAELLTETYERLASTMITSFDDAGAAIGEINTRWGYTGEELEDLSALFLKFASINGQDVESAIIGVDHAMKMFNVDAEMTDDVLGLLTSVGQRTGISVATLESSLQSNGATLLEMGLGISESVELMGMLEQSGADANTVLSSMKKAASECSKEGKDFSTVLQDLLTRLQDSDTAAEATTEAYDIFGTRAGLTFVSLAKQGKLSLDGLNDDLAAYQDVVDTTYDATLDGLDQITITTNKVKLALSKLGNTISDAVVPILNKLNNLITKVTKYLDSLSQEEREQIVKIGAIVAAAGPAIIIGGKIVSAVGLLITKIGSLVSTIGGLINPVTATIAAITALGVAVGLAADEMEDANMAEYGWDEEAKAFNETLEEQADELAEVAEARKLATDSALDETENIETIVEQLDKIVDKNGYIKDGYEEQAEILSEKLAYYLGEEVNIIDGQIQKWQELEEQVKQVIRTKKLSLLTDVNEDAYLDAIIKENDAYEDMLKAQKAYEEQLEAVNKAKQAWIDKEKELESLGTANTVSGQIEIGELESVYNDAQEALDNLLKSYKTAEDNYYQYSATIKTYEDAIAAATSENAEDIDTAVQELIDLANTGTSEWKAFFESLPEEMSTAVTELQPVVNKFRTNIAQPIQSMLDSIKSSIENMSTMTGGSSSSGNVTVTSNVVLDGNIIGSTTDSYLGGKVGKWIKAR